MSGLSSRLERALSDAIERGGFRFAVVVTDQGLTLAQAGDIEHESLGGVSSLLDEVILRARRDLDLGFVDEVTLLDPIRKVRLVLRPLSPATAPERTLLVLGVPPRRYWRRVSNQLVSQLRRLLRPLTEVA